MKYTPDEEYSTWVERVKIHELKIAQRQVFNGQDPTKVFESMSMRIMEKLLHPHIKTIEQEYIQQNKSEVGQYQENYLSKIPPRPDHVDE